MKFFPIVLILLGSFSSSFAHQADPDYLLAKYSLYGKDGISSAPNVVTDTFGKGWIGTDPNFSGSNSTTTYGLIKVGGQFSAASGTYYGSMDVLGNINIGSATFGNLANGPDTVRHNGTYGGGHLGGAITEAGTALISTPQFPTYTVLSDGTKNCTLSSTGWINGTRGGCPHSWKFNSHSFASWTIRRHLNSRWS